MTMIKKTFILIAIIALFSNFSFSQDINRAKANLEFKWQAEALAEQHQWISFKYRHLHYWNNELGWDYVVDVTIKYDGDNSMIFINSDDCNYYQLTDNQYKRLNHLRNEITDVKKNKQDKRDIYEEIGVYGTIPSFLGRISYYIKPIDYAYTWATRNIITGGKTVDINGVKHNQYNATFASEIIESFVNCETHLMDSVYCEYHSKEGDVSNDYFSIYDFQFVDNQQYIDSIFNFSNPKYVLYSRYDEMNYPVMSENQNVEEILDFPLVNLENDTTTLREQEGWILLNFWTLSCGSCLKNLQNYSHEKDSLGYRILEGNGIKILAIEHKSNNMEAIGKVADRMNCRDIVYSAKGIGTKISIPALGYYYLITPDKKIVGKFGDLGNYEYVFKAKND